MVFQKREEGGERTKNERGEKKRGGVGRNGAR